MDETPETPETTLAQPETAIPPEAETPDAASVPPQNGAETPAPSSIPRLSDVEARVLGCLLEKEVTTPEYYPLSLNALRNACNQKSSREPVTDYAEKAVEDAVFFLREKQFACRTSGPDTRVAKFKHTLHNHYKLSEAERAVICLLLLRGPQTLGELRSRSGRLFDFKDLNEVGEVIDTLARHAAGALVVKLPRESGRKEPRYAHLMSGPIDLEALALAAPDEPDEPAPAREDLESLKKDMETLRQDMAALRAEFAEFKKQFE